MKEWYEATTTIQEQWNRCQTDKINEPETDYKNKIIRHKIRGTNEFKRG